MQGGPRMNFFKLIVLIVAATFSTWVFAQNDNPKELSKEVSSLTKTLTELEAEKSKLEAEKYALKFLISTAKKKPENLKQDDKEPSTSKKIENEIWQAIKEKSDPTIFDEKIKNLDQEIAIVLLDVTDKKKKYAQLLDSISQLEKENAQPPLSKSKFYLISTLFIVLATLLLFAQMNVLSVRRRWRAMEPEWTFLFKWVGFCWLLPIFICSCQSGKEIEREFINPQKKLEADIQVIKDSIEKLTNDIKTLTNDFDQEIKKEPTTESLVRKSKEYIAVFKYEAFLKMENKKLEDEIKDTQVNLDKLKNKSNTEKQNSNINETIFLSLLIGAFFFGGVFISWSMVNSINNSKVCPRCFEFGTLVQSPESKDELKCTSEFCKDNSFRLPKRFQNFTKLSFPMISCGSAGKTHWLLNIYSMNRKGYISIKKNAALYKIDVIDNKEFNIRERALAEQTSGGASIQPTLATTTPPLIFSLKDNKNLPLGFPDTLRSRGLSLCFDYAGEVRLDRYKETQDMIARSNGIVFFLDVINIDKSQIDFTNRKNNKLDQLLMTNNYDTQFQTDVIVGKTYADFVIARDLTEPNPLDLPVAICLSKIDLLPFQGPLKGSYGKKFLKELENCKHPANKWSLSTIMNRSDIIRNYLPLIFANKGMIEIFDQKFGSNYLFFPVANRGLDPDLSFGDPFGVMEPLLWLQHMHGFNVFDS